MANEMPKLSDIFILGEEVTEGRTLLEWVVPTDNANNTVPSLYPTSELQIINNTITPTGFLHTLTYTTGDGNLTSIATTNSRDGALLRVRIADNGKPITIVNGSGAIGAISTTDGNDIVLDDLKTIIEFQLEGSIWRQCGSVHKQADVLQTDPTKPDYIKNTDVLANTDLSNLSEVGENHFVKKDLSNITPLVQKIVAEYFSGDSFYIIYERPQSDGSVKYWCEQGDANNAGLATETAVSVSFRVPFIDTKYTALVTTQNFAVLNVSAFAWVRSKNSSSMTVKKSVSDSIAFSWRACGYCNKP